MQKARMLTKEWDNIAPRQSRTRDRELSEVGAAARSDRAYGLP